MAQGIDNSPAWRRGSYSDLILATGVLLIMSLMVLRLPTPVIDALVAVNNRLIATMLFMSPRWSLTGDWPTLL